MPEIQVAEIKSQAELPELPEGLSFFSVPYLRYWVKEALDLGGDVQVSKTPDGEISGLFVYDNYEENGTVFTRSKEVFDYFFQLRPSGSLWSELQTDHSGYTYDILTMNLDGVDLKHSFKRRVAIDTNIVEIERFMSLTVHEVLNPKWVRIALANGDRCFVAKIGTEIAGVAWLSLVDGVGRVPDLYVKPQFRRTGVAVDLFYARLIYLKSMRARSYFAEIAHDNEPGLKHALKVGMKISGQIFEYYRQFSENAPIASQNSLISEQESH
ncbi:MAG TPA: GNAT family N-acetyltransferase [Nitrososphaerales archaeon]|nr:GNAT family N-acetyltransferase [Nitrososphaerales archaeon]